MKSEFNPTEFRGRNTVSLKSGITGIRILWYWDTLKSQYCRKETGLRFTAIKKIRGKQYEKSFPTLNEAKVWYKTYSPDHASKPLPLTFEELLLKYFEHIKTRINPSTFQTYRNNSIHLEGLKRHEVSRITPQVIDSWLKSIKGAEYIQLQHTTRLSYQKEIGLLTRIFDYYSEYINDHFQSPIKKRHKADSIINLQRYKEAKSKNGTRFMSNEESLKFLNKLLGKSNKNSLEYGFYCLAILQLHTGLRIGEACALSWGDFVIKEDRVEIGISKVVQWKRGKDEVTYIQPFTKTCGQRTVYIGDEVFSALKEWARIRGAHNGLVFSYDGIAPFMYRAIQYRYDCAFKACSSIFRSCHILRHTFSTEFIQTTRDQHALSKFLGHSTQRQTEHYAKITNVMVDEGYNIYKKHLEDKFENVVRFPVELGKAGSG